MCRLDRGIGYLPDQIPQRHSKSILSQTSTDEFLKPAMGRYDFRALRVYQNTSLLMKTKPMKAQAPWFQIIGDVPPSQTIVRTQPVQHQEARTPRKYRKPSRMFQPQHITYEEDRLRRDFFGDHPWELARPRVMLEDDGKDYQKWDWSQAHQHGRRADGEKYEPAQHHFTTPA